MRTFENVTEELTRSHIIRNSRTVSPEIPVHPKTFFNFTYSKKQHANFFKENKYYSELFDEEIDFKKFRTKDYQNLLVFAFIKKNIPKGAKILQIGNNFSKIFGRLKSDYELWNLPDPSELTKDLFADPNSLTITSPKNADTKLKNYYSYFDFLFSISAFEEIDYEKESYKNILFNLDRLTKYGGYAIHSFNLIFSQDKIFLNKLLIYFYNTSRFENKIQNKFINPVTIKVQPELFFSKTSDDELKHLESVKVKNNKDFKSSAYNILLKKKSNLLPRVTQSRPSEFLKKTPAYIFHHLIKCGGSSAVNEMFNWFNLEFDHLVDAAKINEYTKTRYNIDNINSDTCVVSHFSHQGAYLSQRYPEILTKKEQIKTFIFVRDPLKFKISLYYYIRNQGRFQDIPLLNQLKFNRNFLSALIPCDESNYKEVLNRYFFIGIVEHMQDSFNKLAKLLNKKKLIIPVMNQSIKDEQVSQITPELIEKFKEDNKLDYMVYNYCLEKFLKM